MAIGFEQYAQSLQHQQKFIGKNAHRKDHQRQRDDLVVARKIAFFGHQRQQEKGKKAQEHEVQEANDHGPVAINFIGKRRKNGTYLEYRFQRKGNQKEQAKSAGQSACKNGPPRKMPQEAKEIKNGGQQKETTQHGQQIKKSEVVPQKRKEYGGYDGKRKKYREASHIPVGPDSFFAHKVEKKRKDGQRKKTVVLKMKKGIDGIAVQQRAARFGNDDIS